MKNLLRIDSSLFAEHGVSSQLATHLTAQLTQSYPELNIQHRSFAQEPIPHLDGAQLQALSTPAEKRTSAQAQGVAFSDTLIREVREADAIALTAPMYNFQIPSMLKAWFDHLARAGETFRYTESGPVGLLNDKPVYVITTRGGIHQNQSHDTIETYLTTMLAFMGLTQVHFVYAEALNMGENGKAEGMAHTKEAIDSLLLEQFSAQEA